MGAHPSAVSTFAIELTRSDAEITTLFSKLVTRADVAELLEVTDAYLVFILYRRKDPMHYRRFALRKRSGEQRDISAPPPALAILQRKLNHVLQLVYRRRLAVHGFVRDRSLLTNAMPHVDRRWVLNVDLKDFFPSINFGRVRGMFMAPPYRIGTAAATVLAQICCSSNVLPQGAPTSPIVSNMVCGRLDGALFALARRNHCRYTRYGDDLTFSTNRRSHPAELAAEASGSGVVLGPSLLNIIEQNGFEVNPSKTRLALHDRPQRVTGLTVNMFPNVPRRAIRELRGMLHAWEKFGYNAAESEYLLRFDRRNRRPGAARPQFRDVILGKLEFVRMIRGTGDRVYRKLRGRLHAVDPEAISEPPEHEIVVRDPGPLWVEHHANYEGYVIHLEITKPDGNKRAGTGWAFRSRYLATANHNLVGHIQAHLQGSFQKLNTSHRHPNAEAGVDCALLPTPSSIGPHANYLPITQKPPRHGEPIAVLGFPSVPMRQPALTLLPGHVETLQTDYSGGIEFIQLDIKPAGGLSGAPVINRAGQVIGLIVESTFERTQDGVPAREFCQALPVKYLLEIYNAVIGGSSI